MLSTLGAMAVVGAVVVIVAVSRVKLFGVHSLSENPTTCSVGHLTWILMGDGIRTVTLL